MCINSKELNIIHKTFKPTSLQYLKTYCKCGKCWQCKISKSNEYLFRCNETINNTINNNNYVLWDCLTYDEENVPWAADILSKKFDIIIKSNQNFRCFNPEDLTLFLKRFRENYKYHYKRKADFDYFIAGEYGEKEGKTHRPHYHLIFCIKSDNTPEITSKIIYNSWGLGKCDGICDNSHIKFITDKLITNNNRKSIKDAAYISKYVAKDSLYIKKINEILQEIEFKDNYLYSKYKSCDRLQYIKKDHNKSTYQRKLRWQALKRSITNVHKQSQGFGLSFLEHCDLNNILKSNKIELPRTNLIPIYISLPNIYKQHLFDAKNDKGKFIKDEYGRHVHNDLWKEYYYHRCKDIYYNTFKEFKNIFINSDNITQDIINNLLGNRSLNQLCVYKCYYQGRHKLEYIHAPIDIYYNNFNNDNEIEIGLNKEDLQNGLWKMKNGKNYYKYLNDNTINENSLPEFNNFDKIINIFLNQKHLQGIKAEAAYLIKLKQQSMFKAAIA